MQTIFDFIKTAQNDYQSHYITLNDGLEHNQKKTINLIDLYYNSTFESGKTDAQGQEKPFFNINRNRVHLAVRATDDGGEIRIAPKRGRSDRRLQALLLNARDAEWRDDTEFDAFRRKLRYIRAKYGGVVVKRIKENGTIVVKTVDWSNLITDQQDLLNNPIIERHLYNPSDIMGMNWDNKEDAIALAKKNNAAQASNDATVDNQTIGSFVEVYEVSGVVPTILYDPEKGNDTTFDRYKFIVVMDKSDKDANKGIILYKGKQKENPYDYIPWIEVSGRALGLGIVEMLFEPQVWTNWTKMAERDLLNIARLMLFDSTGDSVNTDNVFSDVFTGHVFKKAGLTQINTTPSAIPSLETFLAAWENLSDKEASSFDAITGEDVNASDPYKKTKLLNYVAGSEFKYRRKEERDFIRRIYKKWVLPDHLSKVDTRKEMEAVLSDDEIEFVDSALVAKKAHSAFAETLGDITKSPAQVGDVAQRDSEMLARSGKSRKITNITKDVFPDDILTDLDVVVGTENDGDAKLALLERFFQAFSPALLNQQAMQNPTVSTLLEQASEQAGLNVNSAKQLSASPVAAETATSNV